LFKEKIGVDLRLRTLVAGAGITLTNNGSDITVTNNRNMIVTVNADTGSLTANSPTQALNIVGGSGISTSITNNTLTITGSNYNIETDTSPALGGNLDLNGFNITGGAGTTVTAENFVGNLTGNVTGNVIGNLTGLVNGVSVAKIQNQLVTFDFGPINNNFSSPLQWIVSMSMLDMGTIANPGTVGLDGGVFV